MRRPGVAVAWLGLAALVVGACSTAGGKGPAQAAPAVQVDLRDPMLPLFRSHEGAALLIDRADPDTVYLGEVEMASGECRFYVSADRGATWKPESAPALLPFTRNCAMGIALPQNLRDELRQGPDGTIYFVFQANAVDRNGSRSVMIGRSSDGGRTWQTSPIDPGAVAPEPGVSMEVNFQGHIAIDPSNPRRIVAMWRRSFRNFPEARPTRPYIAVSEDGGATWSAPRVMFEKNNGFDGPRPVFAGGKLWAFYRESAATAAAGQPPNNTKLFAAESSDGGMTWTDHLIVEALDASEPVPLYDQERGRFYVVWHDNRAQELDVYFSSSADGATWAEPKRLNDDARDTRIGQHYPQISMSPNGRVDVAWYDWRDDPFPTPTAPPSSVLSLFNNRGKVASVYLTSSRDGGATWTANTRVNDVPIDRTIGTWINNADVMAPLSIASWDDGAIVAWSDTRNGNQLSQAQDIYTGTVSFGEGKEKRVTSLQAGFVGVLLGLGVAMCLAFLLVRGRAGAGPRAGSSS